MDHHGDELNNPVGRPAPNDTEADEENNVALSAEQLDKFSAGVSPTQEASLAQPRVQRPKYTTVKPPRG